MDKKRRIRPNPSPKRRNTCPDGDVHMEESITIEIDSSDDSLSPPPTPEKVWAEKMKRGNLFAGLTRSPERPPIVSTASGPSRKDKLAEDLEIEKDALFNMLTSPAQKPDSPKGSATASSSDSHLLPPDHRAPVFNMTSLEAIRTSTGFLEEHINSLKWIQQCLVYHQKTLIRTRNLTQCMLDSMARVTYLQGHHQDLLEIIEGKRGRQVETSTRSMTLDLL